MGTQLPLLKRGTHPLFGPIFCGQRSPISATAELLFNSLLPQSIYWFWNWPLRDEGHRFFVGRMPFLSPNHQHQSTEGNSRYWPQTENVTCRPHLYFIHPQALQKMGAVPFRLGHCMPVPHIISTSFRVVRHLFVSNRWPRLSLTCSQLQL